RGGDEFHRARRVAEHREDERLQVVLGVDDVAEGRVVNGGDDRLRLTERLAADRAGMLDRYGIPLLRHDAAALHGPRAEPDIAEFRRAPEQQILNEPAVSGEEDRRG